MTADKSETVDQEKLLSDFKTRYQNLIGENQKLANQTKRNSSTKTARSNRNARIYFTTWRRSRRGFNRRISKETARSLFYGYKYLQ